MAPTDFFLFPKTEDTDERKAFSYDRGHTFYIETGWLAIPKIAFQKCFEDWKNRWHKCIVTEGGYFKGIR